MTTTIGFILGSAFGKTPWQGLHFRPQTIETPYGESVVHVAEIRDDAGDRRVVVIYRHGVPHRLLPNQINFRANAWALHHMGCQSVVITSSVGVLDEQLPLNTPMLIDDLLMPDHRLPDGSLCTMFTTPSADQGHLVIQDGVFSSALNQQIQAHVDGMLNAAMPEVCFAYVAGPRTKTAAENAFWAAMGAQVNSMSVGPEVVLANELEIPCAGLIVGHKPSRSRALHPDSEDEIESSLDLARDVMHRLLMQLMYGLTPVPFANVIYRFGDGGAHD